MAETMLDHALAWAARGFRIFPLAPGTKVPPKGFDWKTNSTSDPEVIRRVWSADEFGIGVRTDDLIVIDVDVKDGKDGETSFAMMELADGLPTHTLTVKTPSKGTHYYYRKDPIHGRLGMLDGIDVKAIGGYVVAPGTVLRNAKTGEVIGTYELVADYPVAEAPPKLIKRILDRPGPKERSERRTVEETPANVERARHWLAEQAPTSGTFKVACKLRDFGVEETTCLELMLDIWNDRRDVPREVDHIEFRVRNAYEYALNPAGVLSHEAEFGSLSLPEPEIKPRERAKWVWQGDEINRDEQWLFYQKFPRVGTALCVAPSGAGKTFLTAELAACLASGHEFFGTAPDETCGTLMLAAEGTAGLTGRLKVLSDHHGHGLAIGAMPVSMLGSSEAIKALTADLVEAREVLQTRFGKRLGLITIDTLAASGLLNDENNNSECAAAVKALEILAAKFQCLVLVTHHPPKNATGARGGSALHAGFDTVFEIFHDGRKVRFVECTKGRDAPTGKWGSFTLIPQTLGADSKGRDITTCTVSMGSDARPSGGKEPPHTIKFMECFEFARANLTLDKDEPVPSAALRKQFGELVEFKGGHSAASKAFAKCVEWLEANHRITVIATGDGTAYREGLNIVMPEPIAPDTKGRDGTK